MHILFIKTVVNSTEYGFDVGIASLSSVLRENGHTTDLFILRSWANLSSLSYRVNNTKPDIIAFSTYEVELRNISKISSYIRKKYPNLFQVAGGVYFVLNPQAINKIPGITAVSLGEGEYSLLDLLEKYQAGDNSYVFTPGFWVKYKNRLYKNPRLPLINDLDSLPFPDREIFNRQGASPINNDGKNTLEFLFTRGCPFNCTYCSNHALRKVYGGGNYVRRFSPEKAIDWIKNDLRLYACEQIVIHDDSFTIDTRWTLKFLELYKDIRIPFKCNLRISTFDIDILKRMKSCGCNTVSVGIESGDEILRTGLLKRPMSNDEIISGFSMIKKTGLHSLAYLLIGLPDETPKRFINTIKLAAKVAPDKYSLSIYYPYKGTELYQYAKKLYHHFSNKSDLVERLDTILNMKQFKREDILYYFDRFEELVDLLKSNSSLLCNLKRKLKYNLMMTTPSSRYFTLTRFLLETGKFIYQGLKFIKFTLKLFCDEKSTKFCC